MRRCALVSVMVLLRSLRRVVTVSVLSGHPGHSGASVVSHVGREHRSAGEDVLETESVLVRILKSRTARTGHVQSGHPGVSGLSAVLHVDREPGIELGHVVLGPGTLTRVQVTVLKWSHVMLVSVMDGVSGSPGQAVQQHVDLVAEIGTGNVELCHVTRTRVLVMTLRMRSAMMEHVQSGHPGPHGHSVLPRVELVLLRDNARVNPVMAHVLESQLRRRHVSLLQDHAQGGQNGDHGHHVLQHVDQVDRHVTGSVRLRTV